MIVTLTNTTGDRSINVPALGEDGVSLPGGNHPEEATHLTDPLAFPFADIGELADAATSIRGMRPTDWDRQNRNEALSPAVKWSMLVQAGTVTLGNAQETGIRDPYEEFLTDV